jgi:RNA polymerase sigma-70 factor, ECF subfamily
MKPEPAATPSKARVETSPEERDWIARCRAGDARAYRALVERYQDRAYALAYRMVRSRPDAEEIAQDAFVRAWRAIGDFRGDASFMTWLYRILVRLALDRAETLKGRRGREVTVEDTVEPEGPATAASDGGLARRMDRLLAGLPPAQRAALTLFYYEDRPVAEIAQMLNMPENTVKTPMSRGRAALREGYVREEHAGGLHGR